MEQYGIEDKGRDFMFIAECLNRETLSSFQQFALLSIIEYYFEYYGDFQGYSILLTLLEDKVNYPSTKDGWASKEQSND